MAARGWGEGFATWIEGYGGSRTRSHGRATEVALGIAKKSRSADRAVSAELMVVSFRFWW